MVADDDTEVYTERSLSNNSPVKLTTQKSLEAHGGGEILPSQNSSKKN